jgi:catechol 2,3-dioxygenase-like lactoylglutathione lyase family enzyme
MASIRYMVDNVDEAIAFYTRHLEFEVSDHMGAPFASIVRGDLTVWLSGPKSSAQRSLPDGRQPVPGGWNRLVIEVRDLDAVVAGMLAAGVTFRNGIQSGPGGKQVLCDDPSGNPIELFEPA